VSVIGVIAAGAGGVETLREGLIEPLLDRGHVVVVTLTPTASRWLREIGELGKIEQSTGYPVRDTPRLPWETSPHPKVDLYVAAPLTASSVAKLATGIADNQALTALCESIGTSTPMIVFPRVNAAHARQPAWQQHIGRLSSAKVHLVYGEDVWPLAEPRSAGPRDLPWDVILSAVERVTGSK
jgi:hypothetical protein